MSTETIALLHQATKTAFLIWLGLRRAGLSASWFLVLAFGMFMAVRCLILVRLQMAGVTRPW